MFPFTALSSPDPFPTPVPSDPRCGQFGFGRGEHPPLIPVAYPIIQDMTLHGDLSTAADAVAAAIAADLDLAGAFLVRTPASAPVGAPPTWNSDLGFDYLGWREAGAYMVVVGELSPVSGRELRLRIDCYLTEEGDRLAIGGAEAVVTPDGLLAFVHRYINALQWCITGLPGVSGTRIAFARKPAGGVKEIYFTELGSGTQVQVSHDGDVAMLPTWAPGGRIAYTGYRSRNADLYLDGKVLCDRSGMNTGMAFAPDGKVAALTQVFEGNIDICLVDAASCKEIARLTTHPGIDTSPSWSPDGRQIAFVSDRGGGPQVFVMGRDGGGQRALALPGSYNTSPDWSPDGREIAYQSRGEGAVFSIWSHDVESGATRRLTSGPWADEEPSYSPDGRKIAFTSTRRGGKLLFVMGRDGSDPRPVFTEGGEYFTPAWERAFRVSR